MGTDAFVDVRKLDREGQGLPAARAVQSDSLVARDNDAAAQRLGCRTLRLGSSEEPVVFGTAGAFWVREALNAFDVPDSSRQGAIRGLAAQMDTIQGGLIANVRATGIMQAWLAPSCRRDPESRPSEAESRHWTRLSTTLGALPTRFSSIRFRRTVFRA